MTDVEKNNYPHNNNPYYGATDSNLKDWKNVNMGNDEEVTNQFWDTQMRLGFIRKIYGILTIQISFTVFFCLLSVLSPGFKAFQIASPGLFWICLIGTIITSICLICFRSLSRNVPTNYILLGTFTFCEAYLVSFICGTTKANLVLMAAIMTCAVVISLTIYAFTTKTDFTMMGGTMFVLGCIMLLFGLFLMFTNNKILHVIYSCLGVFVFSLYLIYDTQLIIGNHENKLDIDDYIVGAMMLYIDIIQLFLHILSLLKQADS